MGTARLKEAKNLIIRVNGKGIIFELDIAGDDVIETMIVALDTFILPRFSNQDYPNIQPSVIEITDYL